jgi:hypothetical protein
MTGKFRRISSRAAAIASLAISRRSRACGICLDAMSPLIDGCRARTGKPVEHCGAPAKHLWVASMPVLAWVSRCVSPSKYARECHVMGKAAPTADL